MLRIILFIVVNGLLGTVQAHAASHGVILQYHHVAEKTPSATSVTPALFSRQMRFLKENGFIVWPLTRLVEALQSGDAVPDGVVVITFDDAYDDIHDVAAPILKTLKFPFTVFVSTEFVVGPQRGYMSWEQLRSLVRQGVSLANHTHTHPHLLRRLQGEDEGRWKARLQLEVMTAERLLKLETGENHRYLAYPYGETDERITAMIQSWGYLGFGQQSGAVDKPALLSGMVPRFPFNNSFDDMLEFQYKASSVPLPIKSLTASPTVQTGATIPRLDVQLPATISFLQCFASGQGSIPVTRSADNHFTVRAGKAIPTGRSRYNCTSPVEVNDVGFTLQLAPRFYWYSHQWIRKQDDGQWYPEP